MSVPKMQLVDWLDDLSVRFIVNLPKEELQSVERICFQVEEAQWFYEDFVRPTNPQLPSMNLKQFCLAIFHHCPLFAGFDVEIYMQAFQEFLAYKSRVPVRGAILLNDVMDEVVLVRGWKKGANWSFPRGKINKAEDDLDCAIREVFEETGLDVLAAGLIPENRDVKSIDVTLREQSIKLFVIPNVPKDTQFQPQTRKEIGSIQWYKLADLPTIKKLKQQQQHHEGTGENLATHANKFYMVAPFLGPLRKIITHFRKINAERLVLESRPEVQLDPYAAVTSTLPIAGAHYGGIGPTSPWQPSAGNDMDRLLTQLRQSKEAQREQNLPEVSQPTVLGPDGLPVRPQPYVSQSEASIDAHQIPRFGQYPSMLPADTTGAFGYSAPQTPLSNINSQPVMPPSPTHQHRPHITHDPGMHMPPPAFAFSPSQVQASTPSFVNQHAQVPGRAVELPWTASSAVPSASQSRPPAPYMQVGDPEFSVHSHPSEYSRPAVPEPSNLPPPKLTANSAKLLSLFTGGAQSSGSPAAEMSAEPQSRQPTVIGNQQNNGLEALWATQKKPAALAAPLSISADRVSTPAMESPSELGVSSPAASQQRNTQQSALLDLFKSQSGRSHGTLSPALAPNLITGPPPTELSATTSPAQTFSSFPDRRAGSSEALALPSYGKVTIQKRHKGNASVSNAMSATVTGPLNVSEQELQQRAGEARGQSSSASYGRQGPILTPGTVKILSRPGTSSGPNKNLDSPKEASPKAPRSPRRVRHDHKQEKPSPKPFQPQILKRPVEHAAGNNTKEFRMSSPQPIAPQPTTLLRRGTEPTSPLMTPPLPQRSTPTIERGIVEAPSPVSLHTSTTEEMIPVSAVTPGPSKATPPFFDRRSSQTNEQKANLLSLFNNSNTGMSRNSPTPSLPPVNITSNPVPSILGPNTATPIAMAPPPQPAISPLSGPPPRTRMGSMASIGSGDSMMGRHTPQTTNEKDRKFLLGFLNNVADGKGT